MKVWVTTVEYRGFSAQVFGVHHTHDSAWANLNLNFRNVKECRGAGGKCECDFDEKIPHFHGTAHTLPRKKKKGCKIVSDPLKGPVYWTLDEFEIE
jgi:hypothetical protein